MILTARQTSLSPDYASQIRGWNAILLLLFVLLLVVRLAMALGDVVHFDEPFWMARGDFFVQALSEGNWAALQDEHWAVAGEEGSRRIFTSYVATGSGTAFLTGLGRRLLPLAPGTGGIDKVLAEVMLSRLFHVGCSVLTPVLLLLLAGRLGLGRTGRLWLFFYLIFDPVFLDMGSKAHLESFLTLTIPVSLLLYALARERESLFLTLLGGAVFGLAFATRVNAGVVVIAATAYSVVRILYGSPARGILPQIRKEVIRLLLFGLVGWAVFILCFPPLWKSPFFGFVDFLYQQVALAGGGGRFEAPAYFLWTDSKLRFCFLLLSLAGLFLQPVRSSRPFQLGALLLLFGVLVVSLPATFFSRYLSSCLPGLALTGSSTLAYALAGRGRRLLWLNRLAVGSVLALSILIAATVTLQERGVWRKVRGFYGALHSRGFAGIEAPYFASAFHRSGTVERSPALLMGTTRSHVQLLYLGVLVTDGRRLHQLKPGWTRTRLEAKSRCEEGDWKLARLRPWNRAMPNQLRLRQLIAWPCGD